MTETLRHIIFVILINQERPQEFTVYFTVYNKRMFKSWVGRLHHDCLTMCITFHCHDVTICGLFVSELCFESVSKRCISGVIITFGLFQKQTDANREQRKEIATR